MKSLTSFTKYYGHNLQNLKTIAIFFLSIIFYMQVFHDLTWFPDELHGHWIIKRLIFVLFFSMGYLFQFSFFKRRFPTVSKVALNLSLAISILWPALCSFRVLAIFLLIVGLLFLKVRKNELVKSF